MIQKTDDQPEPVRYLVTLQAINQLTPMDKLPDKFRLVAGGCGIRVVDMQRMEAGDQIPKAVALSMLDVLEGSIDSVMPVGDQAGQDGEYDEV